MKHAVISHEHNESLYGNRADIWVRPFEWGTVLATDRAISKLGVFGLLEPRSDDEAPIELDTGRMVNVIFAELDELEGAYHHIVYSDPVAENYDCQVRAQTDHDGTLVLVSPDADRKQRIEQFRSQMKANAAEYVDYAWVFDNMTDLSAEEYTHLVLQDSDEQHRSWLAASVASAAIDSVLDYEFDRELYAHSDSAVSRLSAIRLTELSTLFAAGYVTPESYRLTGAAIYLVLLALAREHRARINEETINAGLISLRLRESTRELEDRLEEDMSSFFQYHTDVPDFDFTKPHMW